MIPLVRGVSGSLAARLVGLFTLGALVVFALLGASLLLMLRGELRARDLEELDSKTEAIAHHLEGAATRAALVAALPRFVDTEVGHAHLRLGVWLDGHWLMRPAEDLLSVLAGTQIPSIAAGHHFDVIRAAGATWWVRRVPHAISDSRDGVSQSVVAINVSEAQRVQDRFNLALAMIGTTGILLMTVLAWWAVRRGLAPLERIAAQAQRVTAQRLGEPLAIAEAPEEVRGVVEGLNRMLARLDDSFRSLEQFSADIAHELRTPLNSLTLRAQVTLSRDRTVAEYQDALHDTLRELEALQKTVSDMLFIARNERGMATLTMEPVDLRAEALEVAEYFELLAVERGIGIEVHGAARVQADRLMIRRAITNLLSNAVRYSLDRSTVQIRIAAGSSAVRLSVANRCEPLSQAQLDRLFDRFARGHGSRERHSEGSGLGLAIVRSIVALHRGDVVARSLDDGLEIELSFPLANAAT